MELKHEGNSHVAVDDHSRVAFTAIREWAYATKFESSDQRKADLPRWQHRYNWHWPHCGINKATPISRLGLTEYNLLKLHS